MIFFLKLVAASLVAILLLIVIGIFFLKYKIKKMLGGLLDQLDGVDTVPPFRIKLTAVADQEEFDEDRDESFELLTSEIKQLGFQHIGDFDSDAGIAIRAFCHTERKTHALIYEHCAAGVWTDFVRHYNDNTSWTYATCKEHGMDTMPGNVAKFFTETPVADVATNLWSESPSDKLVNVQADGFARFFQQRYAQEMNWNIKRGGPSESEIRRVCELTDQECTPEGVKAIQDAWKDRISDFLSESAIKQFNKDNNVSRADANHREYRIFAIHDRMPDRNLMRSVFDDFYADDDDDEPAPEEQKWRATLEQVQQLRKSQSAIQIAQMLIQESGNAENYKYIGEVSKPIKAKIWLRPGYEDEEDYDEDVEQETEALDLN